MSAIALYLLAYYESYDRPDFTHREGTGYDLFPDSPISAHVCLTMFFM